MSEKLTKLLTPIVALFFATALGVTAATTIGTDITTGGDLDVTGNSTLTGTLDVTGTSTLAGLLTAVGADFSGPVSVTLGDDDSFSITGLDGSEITLECEGGACELTMVSPEDITIGNGEDGSIQVPFGGDIWINGESATMVQGCFDYGSLASYESISSPNECDRFYDDTINAPCYYNGTAWKSVLDGTTDCTASAN